MPFSEAKRIQAAKWLDERVGGFLLRLVRLVPRRRGRGSLGGGSIPAAPCSQAGGRQVRRVLFIKFWGMGSIVLSEPALRRLRRRFPDARVDYLTLRRNRQLFALVPGIDKLLTLPFRGLWRFLFSLVPTLLRLRRAAYDVVFDGEFFVNFSSLLAWLSGAPRIVGFGRGEGAKHIVQDVSVPFLDGAHAARQFLNLIDEEARRGEFPPRPRLRRPERAAGPMAGAGRPYIVINVNASPLALERRWERDRFVSLGKSLLRDFPFDLVLIGSRSETDYVGEAERSLEGVGRVRNLCGALTPAQLAWWLRGAVALVSNDSGPVHLASAYDVPTIALYGPETPARYGPLSSRRLVFYEKLGCSPCMSVENAKTVRCVNDLACMKGIESGPVEAAVAAFVAGLAARTRPGRREVAAS